MSIVTLPNSPGPAGTTWREQDFGGSLPGLLGGSTARVNRLGNRWAVEVPLPAMSPRDARRWAAALSLGMKGGVRWKLRQRDLPSGPIGAPRVAGADQLGMTLSADGFSAHAAWEDGQFVGIITGGVSYLYMLAAPGFADGAGVASLPLTTPLRVVPGDNDVIDFAPSIEGLLIGEASSFSIDRLMLGNVSFAIEEQA